MTPCGEATVNPGGMVGRVYIESTKYCNILYQLYADGSREEFKSFSHDKSR